MFFKLIDKILSKIFNKKIMYKILLLSKFNSNLVATWVVLSKSLNLKSRVLNLFLTVVSLCWSNKLFSELVVTQSGGVKNKVTFKYSYNQYSRDADRVKKRQVNYAISGLISLLTRPLYSHKCWYRFFNHNLFEKKRLLNTLPYFIRNITIRLYETSIQLPNLALVIFSTILFFLRRMGKPIRLLCRFVALSLVFIRGFILVWLSDLKNIILQIPSVVFSYELLFRVELWIVIYLSYIVNTVTDAGLDIRGVYLSMNSPDLELVSSFLMLLILFQYASLYYSSAASRHIMYSTHYLILFFASCSVFLLPEYVAVSTVLFDHVFVFYIILFSFRALREDTKNHNSFLIQSTYKVPWADYTPIMSRFHSVLYRIRCRYSNTLVEIISTYLWFISVSSLYYPEERCCDPSVLISNTPITILLSIIFYLIMRQPAYPILLYLFIFTTTITLSIISMLVISPTGWGYGGLIFQNSINETTFIGNTGMVTTLRGLESFLLGTDKSSINYYLGEALASRIQEMGYAQRVDTLLSVSSGQQYWGDSFIQPFSLTPNDDHNWKIMVSLENSISNNIKMLQSASESNQSDTLRYWPIERNLHIWFGEFLEKDSYYGWSHTHLIDTEAHFDFSPYSLTNVLGDSLARMVITDVLSIFQGPTELDLEASSGLYEWGSNYVPGSSSNKVSGSFTGSIENSYTKDSSQRSRSNGEYYHEWFPGLFVLDGRFDSQHQIEYTLFVLLLIIPVSSVVIWGVINDKPSVGFDDFFTSSSMYNYNFYFFGNNQSETLSTYFWSSIFNSSMEWPTDKIKTDPVAVTANSDLFTETLGYLNSGQFTTSDLDGFFHVSILKHGEGYTTNEYKDFLMPILFPIANTNLYGTDEFVNLNGDQNVKLGSFRGVSTNAFNIETNTEHSTSNPINAMVVAHEVNLEYSTLFDGLLNELEDVESSRGRGYHYEFEEQISDESTKSSLYDPSANYAESGIYEFDTVIDEPKTFEDTDFTVYDSEMEFFLTEEDVNVNDLAALETMFPGTAHLYDKKAFQADKEWTVGLGKPILNVNKAQFSALNDTNTGTLSYEDWYRSKNTNQPPSSTVKDPERSIYYIGFKNSLLIKKIKRNLKNKLGVLRLKVDLKKARFYGKNLTFNLKQLFTLTVKRHLIFNYKRHGTLLQLPHTNKYPNNRSQLQYVSRMGKIILKPRRFSRYTLRSGVSIKTRFSRDYLLNVKISTSLTIKLLKPDRYVHRTQNIHNLKSPVKFNKINWHKYYTKPQVGLIKMFVLHTDNLHNKTLTSTKNWQLLAIPSLLVRYASKMVNKPLHVSNIIKLLGSSTNYSVINRKYILQANVRCRLSQINYFKVYEVVSFTQSRVSVKRHHVMCKYNNITPSVAYFPLKLKVNFSHIIFFLIHMLSHNMFTVNLHTYSPTNYKNIYTNQNPLVRSRTLFNYPQPHNTWQLSRVNKRKNNTNLTIARFVVRKTMFLVSFIETNPQRLKINYKNLSNQNLFPIGQNSTPLYTSQKRFDSLTLAFATFYHYLNKLIVGYDSIFAIQTPPTQFNNSFYIVANAFFNTISLKLSPDNLKGILNKISKYKKVFKLLETIQNYSVQSSKLVFLPLRHLLVKLYSRLGMRSIREYATLLKVSSGGLVVDLRNYNKYQLKQKWIPVKSDSIFIKPHDILLHTTTKTNDISKIFKLNYIYTRKISFIYLLDKLLVLSKLIGLSNYPIIPFSTKKRKLSRLTIDLFELTILDVLGGVGLYGVKPKLLLDRSVTLDFLQNRTQTSLHNRQLVSRNGDLTKVKLGRKTLNTVLFTANILSDIPRNFIDKMNTEFVKIITKQLKNEIAVFRVKPSLPRRLIVYYRNIISNHKIFKILKKKRFQSLPYNKIIQVDQFDKGYQNTLRTGEKYPTSNYSSDRLMSFYRVYGYVILRAMVSQEVSRDTLYQVRHEVSAVTYKSYHHLPTLKDIVFETTLDYKTRRLLSEMYEHFIYRKSTFILIPKKVENFSGGLDRVYYYFYRDMTENLYPYYRLRLERYRFNPRLNEGFSNEIANYYSDSRKNSVIKIANRSLRPNQARFYPVYWFYFDMRQFNSSLFYYFHNERNERLLKLSGLGGETKNYKPRTNYFNMRASALVNISWYFNRIINKNTLQREEYEAILQDSDTFIPNSFIKPGYLKSWLPTRTVKHYERIDDIAREYMKLGLTYKDSSTSRVFNMFRAINLIRNIDRLYRFLGDQNRYILWEYWQKQLFEDSYVSQGAYSILKKKLPIVLSSSLLPYPVQKKLTGGSYKLGALMLSILRLYRTENEAVWFNLYFSRVEIWFKLKNSYKKRKNLDSTSDLITTALASIIKLRRYWSRYRSQIWIVHNKEYTTINNQSLHDAKPLVINHGYSRTPIWVLSIIHKKRRHRNRSLNTDLSGISSKNFKGYKYIRDLTKANTTLSPLTWHYNTSTVYFNTKFFNSALYRKIFFLLRCGFLRPNLVQQSNLSWSFSILRKANKIAELPLLGLLKNKSPRTDKISFFKWLSHRIINKKFTSTFYTRTGIVLMRIWNYYSRTSVIAMRKNRFNRAYTKAIMTKLHLMIPVNQLADTTRSILYGERKNYKPFAKLPIIDFIRKDYSSVEPVDSFNYDQTKNFFITQLLNRKRNRILPITRVINSSIYGWIDRTTIRWSAYRALLVNYRYSIRKAIELPFSDIMPIVSSDLLILLINIQPVTYEDCKYYREYTEVFITKLIRLFIRKNTEWSTHKRVPQRRPSTRLLRRKLESRFKYHRTGKWCIIRLPHVTNTAHSILDCFISHKDKAYVLRNKKVVWFRSSHCGPRFLSRLYSFEMSLYRQYLIYISPVVNKITYSNRNWINKFIEPVFSTTNKLLYRVFFYINDLAMDYSKIMDTENYLCTSVGESGQRLVKCSQLLLLYFSHLNRVYVRGMDYSFLEKLNWLITSITSEHVKLITKSKERLVFNFKIIWWVMVSSHSVRKIPRELLASLFDPLLLESNFCVRLDNKHDGTSKYRYNLLASAPKSGILNLLNNYYFNGLRCMLFIDPLLLTVSINNTSENTKPGNNVIKNSKPYKISAQFNKEIQYRIAYFHKTISHLFATVKSLKHTSINVVRIKAIIKKTVSLVTKKTSLPKNYSKYFTISLLVKNITKQINNVYTHRIMYPTSITFISSINHFVHLPKYPIMNNKLKKLTKNKTTTSNGNSNLLTQHIKSRKQTVLMWSKYTQIQLLILKLIDIKKNKIYKRLTIKKIRRRKLSIRNSPMEIENPPFHYNKILLRRKYRKSQVRVDTTLLGRRISNKIDTKQQIDLDYFEDLWYRKIKIFRKKIIPVITVLIKIHIKQKKCQDLNIISRYHLKKNTKPKLCIATRTVFTTSLSNTQTPTLKYSNFSHNLINNNNNKNWPVKHRTNPDPVFISNIKLSYLAPKKYIILLKKNLTPKVRTDLAHLTNSFFFPLVLDYRHYIEIFQLTWGPFSNIRKGWTAIAQVMWYARIPGTVELLRISKIVAECGHSKYFKTVWGNNNNGGRKIKKIPPQTTIPYNTQNRVTYSITMIIQHNIVSRLCGVFVHGVTPLKILSFNLAKSEIIMPFRGYAKKLSQLLAECCTGLKLLDLSQLHPQNRIITNHIPYVNSRSVCCAVGTIRHTNKSYSAIFIYNFLANWYTEVRKSKIHTESKYEQSTGENGLVRNKLELVNRSLLALLILKVRTHQQSKIHIQKHTQNIQIRRESVLGSLSKAAYKLSRLPTNTLNKTEFYRVNKLFLALVSTEDLIKLVNAKYMSRYHWVFDVSFGCTRWGNAFSQVMWFELMLASIHNEHPSHMRKILSSIKKLNKLITTQHTLADLPAHNSSFVRFGNSTNQNKTIAKKLSNWSEYDNETLVGDNIREDDYYAEWSDSSATSDWSRISQYKIVEDATAFVEEEGLFLIDSSANYSSELTDATHSHDYSRSDTSNDGQFHDILRKPHLGITSYYSDLGTSQIERNDVTIKLRDFNFESFYQNTRHNRTKNQVKPLFRHSPVFVTTSSSDKEKPRKLRYWIKKSKSPHIEIYNAYGLSTHGDSSKSYTDTTQSDAKNTADVLGGSRNWSQIHGEQDEVFGWFEADKDIPITGHGIRGGSRNRRTERGWLSNRWNLGFTSSTSNIGALNNTTDSGADNNFWNYYDEEDSGPFFQEYMREVLSERTSLDEISYSSKLEVNNNRLSEDLYYANESYKAIFKYFPQFRTGNWSNSDSGQTSWGFNRYVSDSEIVNSKKTYNPISGVYFIDTARFKKDISDYGNTYVSLLDLRTIVNSISNHISDDDTLFYDDKIVSLVNPWFSWLEFVRHALVTRWRLTLDYTKSNINNTHYYPSPIVHELYYFKYLSYSRFVGSLLRRNSLTTIGSNRIVKGKTHKKREVYLSVFDCIYSYTTNNNTKYRNGINPLLFCFFNINTKSRFINYLESDRGLMRDGYNVLDFNSMDRLESYDLYDYPYKLARIARNQSVGSLAGVTLAPNEPDIDVLVYSRNIGLYRKKSTSGLYTYTKPYRNVETTSPYEANLFSFDPENAKRLHQHFAHHRDDIHAELANYSSDASEIFSGSDYDAGGGGELSLTNDPIEDDSNELVTVEDGEYLDKMPATSSKMVNSIAEINPSNSATNFGNYSSYKTKSHNILIGDESDYFNNSQDESFVLKQFKGVSPATYPRSGLELKNSFRKYRRKDSNLKYTRNWFISNHIWNQQPLFSLYSPSWAIYSDFDVDRNRSRLRSHKHGSTYRLNFNTELWWTRHEKPDLSIRRVDGLEFDDNLGAFDSDGEIGHLHKGISDVAHLPELAEIAETTLPLFEKSLIDPESPALNEDGEFPEFDLNVVYSTVETANIKLFDIRSRTLNKTLDWVKRKTNRLGGRSNELGNRKFVSDTNLSMYNKWDYAYWRLHNSKVILSDLTINDDIAKIDKDVSLLVLSNSLRIRNYQFGGLLSNINNIDNPYDVKTAWDIGDMVDAMSVKDSHPINSVTEQIFDTLIDEKIDEALEFYTITGVEYSTLFYNSRRINSSNHADWYSIDFLSEVLTDSLENIAGFSYDLILHKYSGIYWGVILEVDSSWDDSYSVSYPQVHDNIEGDNEYLPIWNYDPSLWERPGLQYNLTPLVHNDDSKLVVNSKISTCNFNTRLLESKDLVAGGVSSNSLGWSAADIINGLSDWLPYDLMYASDDDSDVDLLVDAIYNTEGEEEYSPRGTSSFWSRTTETDSDEYPALGIKRNIVTDENFEPTDSDGLIVGTEISLSMTTENLSPVSKDEIYNDSVAGSTSDTGNTSDRYVSTEGHEMLDSKKLGNNNEEVDSHGEPINNVANLDSSDGNDIVDTRAVNNLNTQRRSLFFNDKAPVYGELDIASDGGASSPDHLKLKSIKDVRGALKENRELLVASGHMGKRSHPQFDIGGEVGYKSGLFESRFWYDIYSYINSATQDSWSNKDLTQIVGNQWRNDNIILSVQQDTGIHSHKGSLRNIIKKNSHLYGKYYPTWQLTTKMARYKRKKDFLKKLLYSINKTRITKLKNRTYYYDGEVYKKDRRPGLPTIGSISREKKVPVFKTIPGEIQIRTGDMNSILRSNLVKYGFISEGWSMLSHEYGNWGYQYSKPAKYNQFMLPPFNIAIGLVDVKQLFDCNNILHGVTEKLASTPNTIGRQPIERIQNTLKLLMGNNSRFSPRLLLNLRAKSKKSIENYSQFNLRINDMLSIKKTFVVKLNNSINLILRTNIRCNDIKQLYVANVKTLGHTTKNKPFRNQTTPITPIVNTSSRLTLHIDIGTKNTTPLLGVQSGASVYFLKKRVENVNRMFNTVTTRLISRNERLMLFANTFKVRINEKKVSKKSKLYPAVHTDLPNNRSIDRNLLQSTVLKTYQVDLLSRRIYVHAYPPQTTSTIYRKNITDVGKKTNKVEYYHSGMLRYKPRTTISAINATIPALYNESIVKMKYKITLPSSSVNPSNYYILTRGLLAAEKLTAVQNQETVTLDDSDNINPVVNRGRTILSTGSALHTTNSGTNTKLLKASWRFKKVVLSNKIRAHHCVGADRTPYLKLYNKRVAVMPLSGSSRKLNKYSQIYLGMQQRYRCTNYRENDNVQVHLKSLKSRNQRTVSGLIKKNRLNWFKVYDIVNYLKYYIYFVDRKDMLYSKNKVAGTYRGRDRCFWYYSSNKLKLTKITMRDEKSNPNGTIDPNLLVPPQIIYFQNKSKNIPTNLISWDSSTTGAHYDHLTLFAQYKSSYFRKTLTTNSKLGYLSSFETDNFIDFRSVQDFYINNTTPELFEKNIKNVEILFNNKKSYTRLFSDAPSRTIGLLGKIFSENYYFQFQSWNNEVSDSRYTIQQFFFNRWFDLRLQSSNIFFFNNMKCMRSDSNYFHMWAKILLTNLTTLPCDKLRISDDRLNISNNLLTIWTDWVAIRKFRSRFRTINWHATNKRVVVGISKNGKIIYANSKLMLSKLIHLNKLWLNNKNTIYSPRGMLTIMKTQLFWSVLGITYPTPHTNNWGSKNVLRFYKRPSRWEKIASAIVKLTDHSRAVNVKININVQTWHTNNCNLLLFTQNEFPDIDDMLAGQIKKRYRNLVNSDYQAEAMRANKIRVEYIGLDVDMHTNLRLLIHWFVTKRGYLVDLEYKKKLNDQIILPYLNIKNWQYPVEMLRSHAIVENIVEQSNIRIGYLDLIKDFDAPPSGGFVCDNSVVENIRLLDAYANYLHLNIRNHKLFSKFNTILNKSGIFKSIVETRRTPNVGTLTAETGHLSAFHLRRLVFFVTNETQINHNSKVGLRSQVITVTRWSRYTNRIKKLIPKISNNHLPNKIINKANQQYNSKYINTPPTSPYCNNPILTLTCNKTKNIENNRSIIAVRNILLHKKLRSMNKTEALLDEPSRSFSRAWVNNSIKVNSKIKLYTTDNQKADFQIGAKVGDIDDSSFWSSATEYVNEQFLFDTKVFNQDFIVYGYSDLDENIQSFKRNKTRLAWSSKRNEKFYTEPSAISEGSGGSFETDEDTSDDEDQHKYYTFTELSRDYRNIHAEISDGSAGIENSYNDVFDIENDHQVFSYIDWGQDSDVINNIGTTERFDRGGDFTADIIRDPSTESLYLDYVENEYANQLRAFPEEVLDWTISDYYSEMLYNNEISDLPNSTNESEQYSIDSSNSISDYFVEIEGTDREIEDSTMYISDDPSSEYTSVESTTESSDFFNLNGELALADQMERNVAPDAHPEVDIANAPTSYFQSSRSNFIDYENSAIYESSLQLNSSFRYDSSKMELEDTSREPYSYMVESKYFNSFFLESILDDILISINLNRERGLVTHFSQFVSKTPIYGYQFRHILFTKTDYLRIYRALMVDLGLTSLMY